MVCMLSDDDSDQIMSVLSRVSCIVVSENGAYIIGENSYALCRLHVVEIPTSVEGVFALPC